MFVQGTSSIWTHSYQYQILKASYLQLFCSRTSSCCVSTVVLQQEFHMFCIYSCFVEGISFVLCLQLFCSRNSICSVSTVALQQDIQLFCVYSCFAPRIPSVLWLQLLFSRNYISSVSIVVLQQEFQLFMCQQFLSSRHSSCLYVYSSLLISILMLHMFRILNTSIILYNLECCIMTTIYIHYLHQN